jgi:hypothetical protein
MRRAWLVEIGNQGINYLKGEARLNKELRSCHRPKLTRARSTLKSANNCGANGYDPAAASFSLSEARHEIL